MKTNILLLIFSLVLALGMGEVAIRVVKPQQLTVLHPEMWDPADGYGWRHAVEANTTVNTGEGLVHFKTDAEGHRINVNGHIASSEFDKRILILGDSFMEALQVENRQATPELLKKGLKERYTQSVGIDNTGVAGWNPIQYLLQARESLNRRKYDVGIVFLYTGNDIIGLKREGFPAKEAESHPWRFPKSLEWEEIIDSLLYPFNEGMERISHLYVFLKNSSQTMLAKVGLTAYYFPDIFLINDSESRRWDVTTNLCLEIQQEFSKYSTPVIFVLIPTPSQVHEEFFKRYVEYFDIDVNLVDLNLPNKRLPKKFKEKNLHIVDLLEPMKGVAAKGEKLYGRVDDHLNLRGHEVVAEKILPIIHRYL